MGQDLHAEKPTIFVVFGMPRTGTTYLYHSLQAHPDIFVPHRKESYYFTANYNKGLAWFASLYKSQQAGQIGADINPMYFLDSVAIERIRNYQAPVKIILGVRDPVDFVISLYGNMIAHGLTVGAVTDVIKGYSWKLTPEFSFDFKLSGNFMQSKVHELRETFDADLLLYDFRYFNDSPLGVLQQIEQFIGVNSYFNSNNVTHKKINASGRKNPFFLNKLVTNQHLLDLVYSITPTPVIRQLRRAFERYSAPESDPTKARADNPSGVTAEQRAELEKYFESDRHFYDKLFLTSPIIDGTGKNLLTK